MDNSRTYQSQQQYSCGNGTANINIYNGRLTYNYPIMSIEKNLKEINVGLTYNSNYLSTDFGGIKIGFGNGWKYNFESYLFPYQTSYNIEGFLVGDYIYLDASWNIHRFIEYKQEIDDNNKITKTYYDDSGTGLKLEIIENESYKIYDELFNVLYFSQGKLIKVESGINNSSKKIIIYNEGNISSIYDEIDSTKKIEFTYNTLGLPTSITNTISDDNIYYELNYNNTKLKKITKRNNETKKELQQFMYNIDNLLEYVINEENKQTLYFYYILHNNKKVLFKVISGFIKEEIEIKNDNAEIYCGEDNYIGENFYVTNNGLKVKQINLVMPDDNDNYVNIMNQYDYQNAYTQIENQDGIKYRYYFDKYGRTISNFEYQTDTNTKEALYTTYKPTGWEITIDGGTNLYLNNNAAKLILVSNNKYTLNISSNQLNEFRNEMITYMNQEESSQNIPDKFILSFWINFYCANDSDLTARVKYYFNDSTDPEDYEESYFIMNNTLGNAWQLISLNLDLKNKADKLDKFDIIIEIDQNNDLYNGQVLIGDVRINKGQVPTICIDDSREGNLNFKELKHNDKIYYYENGEEKESTISSSFYLTQNDIDATFRSIAYKQDQTKFDLYYCNKTKVKSVEYINVFSNQSINPDKDYYKFKIDQNGIPNYHIRYVDLYQVSKEEDKIYSVTEIQKRYHSIGNNRFYIETKTATANVSSIEEDLRLSDIGSVLSYEWYNDDGTIRATKYCKPIDDSHQTIKTTYLYDDYGNVESITTKEDNDISSESLVTSYTYNTNGKDNVIIEEDNITLEYEYNPNGSIKDIVTTNSHLNFVYDDLGELNEIRFLDENNLVIGKNIIGYDKKGNINLLKDANNVKHGFIYNALSEICEVYNNSKLKEKYKIVKKEDNSISYEKELYQKGLSKKTYDQYGRITSYSILDNFNNLLTTTFEYEQDNTISPSLRRINEIIDPFTGEKFTYTYDENKINETESSVNLTVIDNNTNTPKLEITKNNNQKVEYNFTNDSFIFESSFEQVDNLSKNLRVLNNKLKNKNTNEEEDTNIPYFCYTYIYDHLNRLTSKKYNEEVYDLNNINGINSIFLNKGIAYNYSSKYPSKIEYLENVNAKINNYNYDFEAKLSYEIEYQNGNISKLTELGKRFIDYPHTLEQLDTANFDTIITNYQYDHCNRLIKEIKTINNGTEILEYTYSTTSKMLESIKKNNTVIIKSFEYNTLV